jgi:hypothetical protein
MAAGGISQKTTATMSNSRHHRILDGTGSFTVNLLYRDNVASHPAQGAALFALRRAE